ARMAAYTASPAGGWACRFSIALPTVLSTIPPTWAAAFLSSDRCDALRSLTTSATTGATAAIAMARTNHVHPHRRPGIAAHLLPRAAAIASPLRYPLLRDGPRRITDIEVLMIKGAWRAAAIASFL